MLELPEIVRKLQNENLNTVSMDTHINYQQIWRIKSGKDCNPTYKTIKALSDYFLNKLDEYGFELHFELHDVAVVYKDGPLGYLPEHLKTDFSLSNQELGELFRTALLLKA